MRGKNFGRRKMVIHLGDAGVGTIHVGKWVLTEVIPSGFVPVFTGKRPGNGPFPAKVPMPIRFALSGFTATPCAARSVIASGMLLVGSPPSEVVTGDCAVPA